MLILAPVTVLLAAPAQACEPYSCAPWNREQEESQWRLKDVQGADEPLDASLKWKREDKQYLLVKTGEGWRIVASSVWSAIDDMGYLYFRHDKPGNGWSIEALPAWQPVAGSVESVQKDYEGEVPSDRDYALTLKAGKLPAIGIAQRCSAPDEDVTWCSVVVASQGARQLIYSAPVETNKGVRSTGYALEYVGDINRDGILDVLFRASWSGGAFCSGPELYLSNSESGRISWRLAAVEIFCD